MKAVLLSDRSHTQNKKGHAHEGEFMNVWAIDGTEAEIAEYRKSQGSKGLFDEIMEKPIRVSYGKTASKTLNIERTVNKTTGEIGFFLEKSPEDVADLEMVAFAKKHGLSIQKNGFTFSPTVAPRRAKGSYSVSKSKDLHTAFVTG